MSTSGVDVKRKVMWEYSALNHDAVHSSSQAPHCARQVRRVSESTYDTVNRTHQTLIAAIPPPRGVSRFGRFPNQERGGRGPPSKKFTRCFEGGLLPPGSWLGNLSNRKKPRGGGFRRSIFWHTIDSLRASHCVR